MIFSSGLPERPQSLHDTSSSEPPVFLFSRASPRQKSQYGDGWAAEDLPPAFFSPVGPPGVGGPPVAPAVSADGSEETAVPPGEDAVGR